MKITDTLHGWPSQIMVCQQFNVDVRLVIKATTTKYTYRGDVCTKTSHKFIETNFMLVLQQVNETYFCNWLAFTTADR